MGHPIVSGQEGDKEVMVRATQSLEGGRSRGSGGFQRGQRDRTPVSTGGREAGGQGRSEVSRQLLETHCGPILPAPHWRPHRAPTCVSRMKTKARVMYTLETTRSNVLRLLNLEKGPLTDRKAPAYWWRRGHSTWKGAVVWGTRPGPG